MNPRYIDTYRRHRVLFLLPLAIGMLLALWTQVGKPSLYRSSTSLWSDTAGGSANDLTGAPPPAAQEQTTLNELLRTMYFPDAVARKGPLAAYLKTHTSEGWGPGALLGKLRGSSSLDDRIAAALSPKRVTSLVLGPHVLKISYDGPTPEVAYGTVKTIVKEYESQRNALRTDALNAYRDAVSSASKALRDARTEISAYTREHPGASSTDPQMQSLVHAERNALDQLSGATQALGQAANSAVGSDTATLRIVDPPEIPIAAYSTHKKLLFSVIAGLFVGALVSILGIVFLTRTGRGGAAAPAYADVEVVRRPEVEPREEPAAAHAHAQAAASDAPRVVADAAAGRRVQARRRKRTS